MHFIHSVQYLLAWAIIWALTKLDRAKSARTIVWFVVLNQSAWAVPSDIMLREGLPIV